MNKTTVESRLLFDGGLSVEVGNRHGLRKALLKVGELCGASRREAKALIARLETRQQKCNAMASLGGRIAVEAQVDAWYLPPGIPAILDSRDLEWAYDLQFRTVRKDGSLWLIGLEHGVTSLEELANGLGASVPGNATGCQVSVTLPQSGGLNLSIGPIYDMLHSLFRQPCITADDKGVLEQVDRGECCPDAVELFVGSHDVLGEYMVACPRVGHWQHGSVATFVEGANDIVPLCMVMGRGTVELSVRLVSACSRFSYVDTTFNAYGGWLTVSDGSLDLDPTFYFNWRSQDDPSEGCVQLNVTYWFDGHREVNHNQQATAFAAKLAAQLKQSFDATLR